MRCPARAPRSRRHARFGIAAMNAIGIRTVSATPGRGDERPGPERPAAPSCSGAPSNVRLTRLTAKAAEMIDMPIAFISIFGRDAPCYNSGVASRLAGSAIEHLVRLHRLDGSDRLVISDLGRDSRTQDLSCVLDYPNLRFYAGVPIFVGGQSIGTLAVMDQRPRPDGICFLDSALLSGLAACASLLFMPPGACVQQSLSP